MLSCQFGDSVHGHIHSIWRATAMASSPGQVHTTSAEHLNTAGCWQGCMQAHGQRCNAVAGTARRRDWDHTTSAHRLATMAAGHTTATAIDSILACGARAAEGLFATRRLPISTAGCTELRTSAFGSLMGKGHQGKCISTTRSCCTTISCHACTVRWTGAR